MRILSVIAMLLLVGCAARPAPVAVPAPPPAAPGMERLLGQPAEAAIALLGPPALDRREGVARQLQFAGACILDLFYYPRAGVAAVATYAEARLADGRAFAAGECLRLLMPRR